MSRLSDTVKEFFLMRFRSAPLREHDPTASWEKPDAPPPPLPPFRPGTPDGTHEHPVVDPNSPDVARAIPTLRAAIPRPHRAELERALVRIDHD